MKQVKFFKAQNLTILEEEVNTFLAEYVPDALDITYKPAVVADYDETWWTAMVTYLK